MPNQVSICIPIAPYHTELAQRAIDSAASQTVACDILTYTDVNATGAGAARNKLLEAVETPFVVFLDADDQIAPEFVERCLSVYKKGKYVYTDWLQEDGVHVAPDHAWQMDGGWHILTTLLATDDVRAVGGFDESLRGGEDTYLWWALTRRGICGIHLKEALFTYGKEGRRAREFVNSDLYRPTMLALVERYGDEMCCGGDNPIKVDGVKQSGDIEAVAMWGGNQRVLGIISGRLYERSSYPKHVWVDPRDVEARPDQWQRVPPPAPATVVPVQVATYAPQTVGKVYSGVEQLATAVRGGQPKVMTADELKATLPEVVKTPDVSKVRKLAGKGKK